MTHAELLGSPESKVEIYERETEYDVRTPSYSLRFHRDTPYIDLRDARGNHWAQLLKASSINVSGAPDVTYEFPEPSHQTLPDGSVVVRVPSSTEEEVFKEQVWICHDDFIETFVTARKTGKLQNIRMLGGVMVGPNMFGESMSERCFNSVYNPQPSEREQSVFSANESTEITTSGMWQPGRRREFLITPFSYGFHRNTLAALHDVPENEWLMASISTRIESQTMTAYTYDAHEDGFSLNLTYDETDIEGPIVTSPSLLLHFAPDVHIGLERFKKHAQDIGHLPEEDPLPEIPWHRGTTMVSWGRQVEWQKDFPEKNVHDLATQAFVTNGLETLAQHDIPIDKIVIDDKWQEKYGTNLPDRNKWPNLVRFNEAQHALGRHVLLWMKLFDPEGLPPELCILDKQGRPIASDPTNPAYIEVVREQVEGMLSPYAFDADGLKLDFLAQLPHGPGLRWFGKERGHAALHRLMKNIYDEAKHAKPDALIEAQVVSPWFADTFDQVRLNDTNERHPVLRAMGSRARLASTLLPYHSIDPDGWPMPDKHSWLHYLDSQPELAGTVTLHYIESVQGEVLDPADFKRIADIAKRTRNHRK